MPYSYHFITSSSPESAFLQELEYAKDELEKFKQQKERDATLALKQSEANNHCQRKYFGRCRKLRSPRKCPLFTIICHCNILYIHIIYIYHIIMIYHTISPYCFIIVVERKALSRHSSKMFIAGMRC